MVWLCYALSKVFSSTNIDLLTKQLVVPALFQQQASNTHPSSFKQQQHTKMTNDVQVDIYFEQKKHFKRHSICVLKQ